MNINRLVAGALLIGFGLLPVGPVNPLLSAPAGQKVPETNPSQDQLPSPDTTIRVTTTLIEVTVVAREKHGQLVTDLKQDNFELYDEGKPQKIQFFTVQRAGSTPAKGVPPAPPSTVASLTSPARIFSNRSSESLGPNAVTVILIDELNIKCEDWPYARDQLMRFLRQVQPGERIGVYVLLPEGFAIVHDFTQDCSALAKRLARWNGKVDRAPCIPGHSLSGVGNELGVVLEGANAPVEMYRASAPGGLDNPSLYSSENPHWDPTILSLKAFAAVARHLAGIPGRKNVVWISNGFPLIGHYTSPTGRPEATTYDSYEQEAMRAVNQANVAIYSVEAQGMLTLSPFDPAPTQEQVLAQLTASSFSAPAGLTNSPAGNGQGGPVPGASNGSAGAPTGSSVTAASQGPVGAPMGNDIAGSNLPVGQIWQSRVDALNNSLVATQAILLDVADRTGGRAFVNTNDIAGAIRTAFDDSHTTYTLGFYPEQPRFDGTFHRIKVKVVGRPEVSLNYRKGYVDAHGTGDPEKQLQDAVWSPLDANGLALTAEITPKTAGYNLSIRIGLDGLDLEPDGGRWKGTVHVVLVQNDDEGGRYNYLDQTLDLVLSRNTYQKMLKSGLTFRRTVAMNAKATSLRVIVVDEHSGSLGSVTIPLKRLKP